MGLATRAYPLSRATLFIARATVAGALCHDGSK